MAKKGSDDVWFRVTYEDGNTAEMKIHQSDLRSGDLIAWSIAAEMQTEEIGSSRGRLPKGKIVSISRTLPRT